MPRLSMDPVVLRHRLNLVNLIAFYTSAALYQVPGIVDCPEWRFVFPLKDT